ncbi:MAG: DUF1461 domain-containing protein [Dehalococcoidales bacterium]|nr:DUF1461 domain-containing protein [Dehalococcoidales bacterium]
MKILGIISKWIFILCLPVLLLSSSIDWAANSLWLYNYGSYKYNVRQTLVNSGIEINDTELESYYSGLISYFNSGEEYYNFSTVKHDLPFDILTTEEVIHFRDVKGLIRLDYRLLAGTLAYVLSYTGVCLLWRKRQYWQRLAWGVVIGSGITLGMILALGLGMLFDFGPLFYRFHLLFFSNNFWSVEGYQLLLFPERFFYDAALFCALATATGAVVLGTIAGWYLWLARSRATSPAG